MTFEEELGQIRANLDPKNREPGALGAGFLALIELVEINKGNKGDVRSNLERVAEFIPVAVERMIHETPKQSSLATGLALTSLNMALRTGSRLTIAYLLPLSQLAPIDSANDLNRRQIANFHAEFTESELFQQALVLLGDSPIVGEAKDILQILEHSYVTPSEPTDAEERASSELVADLKSFIKYPTPDLLEEVRSKFHDRASHLRHNLKDGVELTYFFPKPTEFQVDLSDFEGKYQGVIEIDVSPDTASRLRYQIVEAKEELERLATYWRWGSSVNESATLLVRTTKDMVLEAINVGRQEIQQRAASLPRSTFSEINPAGVPITAFVTTNLGLHKYPEPNEIELDSLPELEARIQLGRLPVSTYGPRGIIVAFGDALPSLIWDNNAKGLRPL